MDDVTVLTETLNSTLNRFAQQRQNYEVEVANLTAEVIRLRAEVEELKNPKDVKADASPVKSVK
jgi:cell division protein FtsB